MSELSSASSIGDYQIVGRLDAPGREMYAALLGKQSFVLAMFDVAGPATEEMLSEAKRSARLRSNTLLPVVDAFRHEGRHAAVFEAVEGMSLLRLLRSLEAQEEQLSDGGITYIGCRLMEALAIAHEATDSYGKSAPLIHGELGPHQMFISWGGQPRLMGVGLSPIFALAAAQNKQPSWATPYVAPEVRLGGAITPRSNAYSAALILWSMYARRPPPAEGTPPSLADIRSDLPEDIVRRIDQALGPRPSTRVSCRLFAETLRKHMLPSDPSEVATRVKALRAMVPAGTPVPPEAMPPSRIAPPVLRTAKTPEDIAGFDDAPTAPSRRVNPRKRYLTPYPPVPQRVTAEDAVAQRPTRKLRAESRTKPSSIQPSGKSNGGKSNGGTPNNITMASVTPNGAKLNGAKPNGKSSLRAPGIRPASKRPHTKPSAASPPSVPPSSGARRGGMRSSRTTLSGRPRPDLEAPPSQQPASERPSVALPMRAKVEQTYFPPKRSTLPSVPQLDSPFDERPSEPGQKMYDFDAPTGEFDVLNDAHDDGQPTAQSRAAADAAKDDGSHEAKSVRVTRPALRKSKSLGALPLPKSDHPRSRSQIPAFSPSAPPSIAKASRPPRASSRGLNAAGSAGSAAGSMASLGDGSATAPALSGASERTTHRSSPGLASAAAVALPPPPSLPKQFDQTIALVESSVVERDVNAGVDDPHEAATQPETLNEAVLNEAVLNEAVLNESPASPASPSPPDSAAASAAIAEQDSPSSGERVRGYERPPASFRAELPALDDKKFAWGWLAALVVSGACCFAAGVWVGQSNTPTSADDKADAAAADVEANAAPAKRASATAATPDNNQPLPASLADTASAKSPSVAETAVPEATSKPADTAAVVASAVASSAPPTEPTAKQPTAKQPAPPPPPVEVDLTKLKADEAYLVVTAPPQPDAHVYVNGQLMGRPGVALVVPCDRPKNVRLGTKPLRKWYGRGRPVIIACQQLTTTTILQ